jgi:hypothetical protein
MASTIGRRALWERLVKEQAQSGFTGRNWCQRSGVAVAAFDRWRKKLSAEPASAAAELLAFLFRHEKRGGHGALSETRYSTHGPTAATTG